MLQTHEGRRVPDVTFQARRNNEWRNVTTGELFAGKTVVVFSLPGAFTPTCSSTHLPRYNELAPAFRASGVDAIVCVSVNDPFVMEEWARDQESANVLLVPKRDTRIACRFASNQNGYLPEQSWRPPKTWS